MFMLGFMFHQSPVLLSTPFPSYAVPCLFPLPHRDQSDASYYFMNHLSLLLVPVSTHSSFTASATTKTYQNIISLHL